MTVGPGRVPRPHRDKERTAPMAHRELPAGPVVVPIYPGIQPYSDADAPAHPVQTARAIKASEAEVAKTEADEVPAEERRLREAEQAVQLARRAGDGAEAVALTADLREAEHALAARASRVAIEGEVAALEAKNPELAEKRKQQRQKGAAEARRSSGRAPEAH